MAAMLVHVAPPADGLHRPVRADFSSEADASQPSSDFDFAPFGSVSSFDLSATCDSSLLTPISSSASPPTYPNHNPKLAAQQYPTPGRDATPPKMYWPSEYSLGSGHQSQSPMSMHASGGEAAAAAAAANQAGPGSFDMYMQDSASDGCPRSPIPALQASSQPPFFPTSYGVMPSIESEVPPQLQDYYVPVRDVNPNNLVMHGPGGHGSPSRNISPSFLSKHSSAGHHHHHHHHGHQRRASAQELGAMAGMSDVFTIPKGPADRGGHNRSFRVAKKQGGGRARTRSEQIPRMILKDITETPTSELPPPTSSSAADLGADPAATRPATESDMPLLKDDTPADEKLLFELRLKHDEMKGRAMWDAILQDYFGLTGKHIEKAALQMKFTRAKSKWVIWTPQYLQALVEAFEEVERDRYKDICDRFRKKIGKNIIDFTPRNVEAKMVELGIEEDLYIDNMSKNLMRRRKKVGERRRASCANGAAAHVKVEDAAADDAGRRPSYDVMGGPDELFGVAAAHSFSEEQTDEILDQIDRRGFAHVHDESPSPADLGPHAGLSMDDDLVPLGRSAEQSEKVARQACEEIIGASSPFIDHQFYHQDLAVLS